MDTADHRNLLRDAVCDFEQREGGRVRVRATRSPGAAAAAGSVAMGYDPVHWRKLAGLGCVGTLIPESHGGVGLGIADLVSIARELGRALAPEPFVPVAAGVAGLLGLVPDSALARSLLPRICDGSVVPQLAWAEPGHAFPRVGSVRWAEEDGAVVLRGHAHDVLPAHGDGWLVVAGSAEGPVLGWVPAGAAGVLVDLQPRIDGTVGAALRFEAVQLAADHTARSRQLTEPAIRRVADDCQLATAAELLGIAESAFQATLAYLRTRRQFGRPIGSFQALQHRAVDLYMQQEFTRAAIQTAVAAASTASGAAWSLECSRAKARAARAALAICKEAVQMHGAMGFADECDVGLHLQRAVALAAWGGNEAAHRARVASLHAGRPATVASEPAAIATVERLDWDALADEEFRLRVRAVFEREYPPELRNPPRRLRWQECRAFYQRLGELGLLALAWPKEHGGSAVSPRKQLIFMQEQDRWGVARAPDMGITMVGPGLIRFGTESQRRRYLPPILRFDHMWCQGFSEPDAGSDLASLRTRAVADGDSYVVDGAKIWTTFAHDATHMFLLARTDPAARKQAGISMLLVDLSTPGITIRPIPDIAGNREFCEVVFEGARVPREALLGRENEGWAVAKFLLANERLYLGNPRQSQNALKRLDAIADQLSLHTDPVFMARLTELRLDVWDLVALFERYAEQVRRGEPLEADVSILKLFGSHAYQRLSELALDALGADAARKGTVAIGAVSDDVMSMFMNARPATIYGGSSEVQRNVLAKQVLQLPDA
jgi:3-oxochol-4-en-24-oyl-CoA dehydrogenase